MSKVKCSLCLQEFDNMDSSFFWRIMKHEDHHDPKKPHNTRNQTFGEVKWIPVP